MITVLAIKNYFKNSKHQIAKFLVVGVSSVVFDIGLLILLKEKLGLRPVVAVALNQLLVITYNFLLNKYWSFASKKMPFKQLGRYALLVLNNYLLSILIMYLFNEMFGLNYALVRLFTIALFFTFNFFLYKHWVYKEN